MVKQQAYQKAANLIQQLKERDELNDLARNPLLLNIIVNLHSVAPMDSSDLSRQIQLPQRRNELYREIFRLQLGDRPLVKNINMIFSANDAQQILQKLALFMVKENKSQIEYNLLIEQLQTYIDQIDEEVKAVDFLKQIDQVSELLIKGEDNYEFAHLSFQGYLAATEIEATKQEDLLLENWDKSWWKETILLYASQKTNPNNLLNGLIDIRAQEAIALARNCINEIPRKIDVQIQDSLTKSRQIEAKKEEEELNELEQTVSYLLYQQLEEYLKDGQWKKADEETYRLMLQIAGREDKGWLDIDSMDKFPCEDLRTIDQLWVKYSNGHFGFSVQKQIYFQLGGTRDYNEEIWKEFCDQVGWRKQGEWVNYSDLTFKLNTNTPRAHLPWWWWYYGANMIRIREEGLGINKQLYWLSRFGLFFSRILTCGL